MRSSNSSTKTFFFDWVSTVLVLVAAEVSQGIFAAPNNEDYEFDFERSANEDSPWTSLIYVTSPKERMCFYEKMVKDVEMDVAYRVIFGGSKREIDFQVLDPLDNLIVYDKRRDGNRHKFTPTVTGDHKLCLDNSFSPWSGKTVYFEYAATRVIEKVMKEDTNDDTVKDQAAYMNEQIEELLGQGLILRENLRKASRHQAQFRHTEYIDRKLAERNYELVNRTSLFNCIAILFTGLVQVGVVRFFFFGSAQMKAKRMKVGL